MCDHYLVMLWVYRKQCVWSIHSSCSFFDSVCGFEEILVVQFSCSMFGLMQVFLSLFIVCDDVCYLMWLGLHFGVHICVCWMVLVFCRCSDVSSCIGFRRQSLWVVAVWSVAFLCSMDVVFQFSQCIKHTVYDEIL